MIPLLHTRFAVGAAIHVGADPHLAPGVHFRIHPSPRLGLPVAPLAVYRVAGMGGGGLVRRDVRWVDARGVERTLPFEVTPDNPVTGHLGAGLPGGGGGTRAVWAQVEAVTPGRGAGLRVTALGGHGGLHPLGTRSRAPWALGGPHLRQLRVEGEGRVVEVQWFDMGWSVTRGPDGGQAKPLRLGAPWRLLDLPTASRPRYAAASGWAGRVADRIARGAPLRLGMHEVPEGTSPGTLPLATPADEAARIDALRVHLEPHLEHLLAAPLPASGRLRDFSLSSPLPLEGDAGGSGRAEVPSLGALLAGALDPGVARWMGLADRDEAPTPPPVAGTPLLYLVRGLWIPRLHGPRDQLIALLMALGMRPAPPHLEAWQEMGLTFPRLVDGQVPWEGWTVAVATSDAPPDPPPPPQVGPELAPTDPRTADGLGRWLPTAEGVPSREARREVTLALGGLGPWSTLAVARRITAGVATRTEGLNAPLPGIDAPPRAAVWIPEEAAHPHRAAGPEARWRLHDRGAAGEGTAYRVAQADLFGRWSPWTLHPVRDKIRPRPPAPVLLSSWRRAEGWEDPGDDPRWGGLRVEVPIPVPDRLAPGGWPVGALRLRLRVRGADGAVQGTRTFGPWPLDGAPEVDPEGPPPPLPDLPAGGRLERLPPHAVGADEPAAPRAVVHLGPAALDLLRPGPGRNEAVVLEVTGWWRDAHPTPLDSEPGGPNRLEVVDPRPPRPVVLDPTLRYAARPDADGLARVRLQWEAGPGQAAWALYRSDETRIVAALRERAEGVPLVEVANDAEGNPLTDPDVADEGERHAIRTLLEALDEAPDLAHRAQCFQEAGRPALVRKPWFQRVEVPAPASGDPFFLDALSGGLRVVAFYRIVALNALGVESPFAEAPLLAVGVPPDGPPPTPTLTVLRASEVAEGEAGGEAGAPGGEAGAEPGAEPEPGAATEPGVAPEPGAGPEIPAAAAPSEAWFELRVPRGAVPAAWWRLRRSGAGHDDPRRMLVVAEGPVPPADAPGGAQRVRVRDTGAAPGEPDRRLAPFTRYRWRAEVRAPSPPGSTRPGAWSPASAPVTTLLLPPPPMAPPTPVTTVTPEGRLVLRWRYDGPLRGGGMGSYRVRFEQEDAEGALRVHEVVLPLRPRRPAADGHPWSPEAEADGSFADPRGRWRVRVVDPAGRAGPASPPAEVP